MWSGKAEVQYGGTHVVGSSGKRKLQLIHMAVRIHHYALGLLSLIYIFIQNWQELSY